MSLDLVIRAGSQPEQPLRWSLIEAGNVVTQGEDLTDVPDGDIDQAFFVLPSQDVFVSRIRLATRSEREARQAAPFLIEDELASTLPRTEVVVGRLSEGARCVFAMRSELAEAWRRALSSIRAKQIWCLPDASAVPRESGPTIFDEGNDLLVYAPDHDRPCHRIEGALAADIFPALLSEYAFDRVSLSPRVTLPAMTRSRMPITETRPPIDIDVAVTQLPLSDLERWPSLVADSHSGKEWLGVLLLFRRASVIAGLAWVLAMGLWAGEGFYFQAQRDTLDDAATARFAQAFPEVSRIVNPEAQLRQRLNALGGESGSSFLLLTSLLSDIIAENPQVEIDSLRFDASTNRLNVTAIYSDFADFDTIRQAGEARGLVIEDSGTQSGDLLVGDFSVRLS